MKGFRGKSVEIGLMAAVAVVLFWCSSAFAEGGYTFMGKIGSDTLADGQLYSPEDVAVDASGNVYVADTLNHRIQKFDSSGTFITKWGSYGWGNGQFNMPQGIAVDAAGNVYVADNHNSRIQKFDSSGTFITKWGSYGSGNGQLCQPFDIAVDASGNVYVADTYNHRIQKFDASGKFVTKWGSLGTGNGQFNKPVGIAIDTEGYVYVGDHNNYRIQKFDSSGNFITKWGSYGKLNGQFYRSFYGGVAVDASGNVYVGDCGMNKFDSSGTFVKKWGSVGSGDGQFNDPTGIAVDALGNVYVADSHNDRIQKFDSDGNFITKWGSCDSDGLIYDATGVATDAAGNVYVADSHKHRIQKFDSSGAFITKWGSMSSAGGGSFGEGDGKFYCPYGIAIDAAGNVYVTDWGNYPIQKFDASGTFIAKWGSWGSGDGQFNQPSAIAIDAAGNMYVADTYNDRIQKLDASGTFITKWGPLARPWGIAVDVAGNVYVADNNVQKFDSSGTFITGWGAEGGCIAVDVAGNVYVAGGNNVQKFDSSGTFITKWGAEGGCIAVDAELNVYVANQKFSPDPGNGNLTISYPNGGQTLTKGNNYTITWNSTNISGYVWIALYKSGTASGSKVFDIATAAVNNGAYSFSPPTSLEDGNDYYIGISAEGGTVKDFSDSAFSIVSQPPKVDTPTISPNGGTFNGSTQVTISCSTPGAEIRYTTDGSDPISDSTLYAAAFTVSESCMVIAKAFNSGYTDSDTEYAIFMIESVPPLDTDGDGIIDDEDFCPNTPADEIANVRGCSISQLDTTCLSAKVKESGNLSKAITSCFLKEIKDKGNKFTLSFCVQIAEDKLTNKWTGIETKAGNLAKLDYCYTLDAEDIAGTVYSIFENIYSIINSSGIGDNSGSSDSKLANKNYQTLVSGLLTAANKRCVSIINAQSTYFKETGIAKKRAQAEAKLSAATAKANTAYVNAWGKAILKAGKGKVTSDDLPTNNDKEDIKGMIDQLVEDIINM